MYLLTGTEHTEPGVVCIVSDARRKTQDARHRMQDARRKTQDAGRTKLIIHKNWTKWDKRLTTNVQRTTDNG